jgi:hypothetical protein
MAAIAVGELAAKNVVVEVGAAQDHVLEERGEPQLAASAHSEVDLIARALCAVSLHTNLRDALMSLYETLEPAEARQRAALVLDRMRKLLPHDLPEDLAELGAYDRPWAENADGNAENLTGRELVYRLAMPAVYLLGAIMLALSVVGSITAIHYVLSR